MNPIGTITFWDNEQEVLKSISEKLKASGSSVSTAESCTGGYLGFLFTALSGSSEYYAGGVSAYSNEIKTNVLKVQSKTIENHGAVSREVAKELADNCRNLMNTTYSISLTGIAGPGGGSKEKPVGTVWCGISGLGSEKPSGAEHLFQTSGNRHEVRIEAAKLALIQFNIFLG